MKLNLHIIFTGLLVGLSLILKANPVHDTVTMGPGYANDVFYSMSQGVVKTESRNNWDIAFYTTRWSAGIIINDGTGVQLYTYPSGDTTAWASLDTAGMAGWKRLYNSDLSWEEGAFNRNSSGHPDYGWGVYNMITHDVVGDSLYVLRLANGSLRKIWIQKKRSITNTYHFKYANINGSNEVSEVINVSPFQSNRMFLYYSIVNQTIVDREPDIDTWDLMWNRYITTINDNNGVATNYLVVGVTNNLQVGANRFHPVAPGFSNWHEQAFSETKAPIGHDWKEFNMAQFQWILQDSLVYFVKNRSGNIYKLTFDYFSGTGTGKTGLVKSLVSLVGNPEMEAQTASVKLFPNPATDRVEAAFNSGNEIRSFRLFDAQGRTIMEGMGLSDKKLLLDTSSLRNGMYILSIQGDNQNATSRLLIKK